jgi:hypothetical protein
MTLLAHTTNVDVCVDGHRCSRPSR